MLANDVDVNGDTLSPGNAPDNGATILSGNGILYTPDPDFAGTDTFTYNVDSNAGNSLTGTVTVTVNDINDVPTAAADVATVVQNTPTLLGLFANDSDIDGNLSTAAIDTAPTNGTVNVAGNEVTYTPNQDFTGDDAFTYRAIDDDGATSNTATVSITVTPITETTLTVRGLTVPTSGYTQQNNSEFGATVLTSLPQNLEIPPNTLSFVLHLRGDDVRLSPHTAGLFLAGMADADGTALSPFHRRVNFCDTGLCVSLVPRRPDIEPFRGDWSFTTGTFEDTLNQIDLAGLSLTAAIRTGPAPDPGATFPATLPVRPFLTADTIGEQELQSVLDRLIQIANNNSIAINLEPVTVVAGDQFDEVSRDFNDSTTAQLVSMGDAAKVNVFFLESFTGADGAGLLGISGGLPGPLGIKHKSNGVLINATATRGSTDDFYFRTTAEIVFHEMGHFLGLFHTTERNFGANDVTDDTPECLENVHDINNNDIADVEECPDGLNPMFWDNDLSNPNKTMLSEDQKHVLIYSPIARP